MTAYRLYVINGEGKSTSWPDHTNGHRGKSCIKFPDYTDNHIVIEHGNRVTFIHISKDGEIDLIESYDDA